VQLEIHRFADTVVAAPAGRIDHLGAAPFQAALQPLLDEVCAARSALVLDFARVEYISSVGLRVLMVSARQTREQQAQLLVANLQTVVREIFAISRFDRVLTVVPTLDEAMAQCGAQAQVQYRAAAGAPRP